jgi:rhodanese-related sulfurtransferase/predicted metal-dependent enzyme (double-stranded beta helix superfamily)
MRHFIRGEFMQLETNRRLIQEIESDLTAAKTAAGTISRTPEDLAHIVSEFVVSDGWIDKVRLRTEQRWYERLYLAPDYDIWVISWLPGQSTGFHDHGGSSGALVVATGILEEHRPGERTHVLHPGKPRAFGPDYAHDVRNASLAPAISIHAYSPPLSDMNEYELDGGQLVPRERTSNEGEAIDQEWRVQERKTFDPTSSPNIDQILLAARTRLRRLSPDEAYEAMVNQGATLVDIRSEQQRAAEGNIPGALIIDRNVLEWRFDPASSARLPIATNHDIQVIVFCSEGYTSSLAAVALQDLGLHRATDVIGGFQEWKISGLPVTL